MPDLQSLYLRFKDQDFVVLAISDEDAAKINPFLAERDITYPVLLDPGRKVNDLFQIQGIPKNFVYDRDGKLVAQSIDMRTQKQFLDMLAKAGLQ
jgi:peroxiredoxin